MTAHSLWLSRDKRIEALRKKHRMLNERVKEARKIPSTTDFYLKQLKKEKLWIKEEIEGIRAQAANA